MNTTFIVVAMVLTVAGTAPAQEQAPAPAAGKDMCLVDASHCPRENYYDLAEKVARLREAINKGMKLYTVEELEILKKKLEESLEIADLLEVPESQIPR